MNDIEYCVEFIDFDGFREEYWYAHKSDAITHYDLYKRDGLKFYERIAVYVRDYVKDTDVTIRELSNRGCLAFA